MAENAPVAGGDDARARLEAAQAAAVQAAADLARVEKPKLESVLERLNGEATAALEADLRAAGAELTDELARQALANVALILASTRATLRARSAEAAHAIALAPAKAAEAERAE